MLVSKECIERGCSCALEHWMPEVNYADKG
jgi:hypothetical protein